MDESNKSMQPRVEIKIWLLWMDLDVLNLGNIVALGDCLKVRTLAAAHAEEVQQDLGQLYGKSHNHQLSFIT